MSKAAHIISDLEDYDSTDKLRVRRRPFDVIDNYSSDRPLIYQLDEIVLISGSSFYLNDDEMPIIIQSPYDAFMEKRKDRRKVVLSVAGFLAIILMCIGIPAAYWQPNQLGGAVFVIGATIWAAVGYIARRFDK